MRGFLLQRGDYHGRQGEQMTQSRYSWSVICPNCDAQINFAEARPNEEPFRKSQSLKITCPECETERTYLPSQMMLGEE
jgi:ribosomal protein S27E